MSNLIEQVVKQMHGSSILLDINEAIEQTNERFNPGTSKELAAVAKMLKIKGGIQTGDNPDEVLDGVYNKFLDSKYDQKQAGEFMKMLMGFASKGYTPKIKSSTKAKLGKFLKSGMHLESKDFAMNFILESTETI